MHQQYRIVSKQCDRLMRKIAAAAAEVVGVSLHREAHGDLKVVTSDSATSWKSCQLI